MSVGQTLYTYKCSNCKSVAITDLKPSPGRPERCKCGSWLRLLYTSEMTDEARALLKRAGMVFNPYAEPAKPIPCVRCEQPVGLMTARKRPDGWVCGKCYEAEAHPEGVTLPTPEEVKAYHAEREQRMRELEDNSRQFQGDKQ